MFSLLTCFFNSAKISLSIISDSLVFFFRAGNVGGGNSSSSGVSGGGSGVFDSLFDVDEHGLDDKEHSVSVKLESVSALSTTFKRKLNYSAYKYFFWNPWPVLVSRDFTKESLIFAHFFIMTSPVKKIIV